MSTAFGSSLLVQNMGSENACRLLRGNSLQPSGWMPPRFQTQYCPDCWAMAPVNAFQGLINIYFNQMLDIDLSDRHIIQCNNYGCRGGSTSKAVEHICETGVLLEEDFSYLTYTPPFDFTEKKTLRFSAEDMGLISQTDNYGGAINALAIDEEYLYVAGNYNQTVKRYWINNMTFKDETEFYQEFLIVENRDWGIQVLALDDDYVYAAGRTRRRVHSSYIYNVNVSKYDKNTLELVGESERYGGVSTDSVINALAIDDEYIYAGGQLFHYGSEGIVQYWKSNMTEKNNHTSSGSNGIINALVCDDTYVYAAIQIGSYEGGIIKIMKSGMAEVDRIDVDFAVKDIVLDNNYIYIAGVNQIVQRYCKDTLNYIDQTEPYGGTIYVLAQDTNYLYAAGDTIKTVRQYNKDDLSFVAETESYTHSVSYGELYDGAIYALALGPTYRDIQPVSDVFAAGNIGKCPVLIEEKEIISADNFKQYSNFGGNIPFFDLELKKYLIEYGPGAAIVSPWGHAMAVVGYGTVKAGDVIQNGNVFFGGEHGGMQEIIVEDDSPFIGATYWIFKQSWGSWGNPKTPYTYVIAGTLNLFLSHIYFFETPITSKFSLNESDRVVRDEDGDGFYTWGIGLKPDGWDHIPDEQDGNDNDASLGPLNDLYQCSVIGKNIRIQQDINLKWYDVLGLGRVDFNRPDLGETIYKTLRIYNPGEDTLVLTGSPYVTIKDNGENVYSVVQQPSSSVIQPGESETFVISFTGAAGGLFKGVVSIPTNDPYATIYEFRLYGNGYEAFNQNTNIWYETIQDAVTGAGENDVLVVYDGEYFPQQEIIITKPITLQSENGAEKTIINGFDYENLDHRRAFTIDNANAKLSGFTIRNFQHPKSDDGGAILLQTGSVDSCIFINNAANYGGAIRIHSGSITQCDFIYNGANYGGAIYIAGSSNVVSIKQCSIISNFAAATAVEYLLLVLLNLV